jgi:hypothetical protein
MSTALGYPGDPERNIQPQPPCWFISDDCPKLIEAMPQMIKDPDRPEEMLKVDYNEAQIGDDAVDSAGMGLQWMIGTSIKPDQVKLAEQVAAVRQKFASARRARETGRGLVL